MKCEHCGKNEVTFVYQSNVNGQVTEKHLCADCAAKLGFTRQIAASHQRMMNSFDSLFNSFGGSFFDSVPRLAMPEPFRRMFSELYDNPLDDLFIDMPALGAAAAPQETEPPASQMDPDEAGRFARTRQLNALRHEMAQAVEAENFERAAQLRDQLRALETQNGEKS